MAGHKANRNPKFAVTSKGLQPFGLIAGMHEAELQHLSKYSDLMPAVLSLPCIAILLTAFPKASIGDPVIGLNVTNIEEEVGMIWIGIYDSEDNFLVKEQAIVKGYTVEHSGRIHISLPDLPFGTYAIAIFHDLNNNGYLDQNLLGIPSEPFAFSRRPKSKFRMPRFEEVAVTFSPDQQEITLPLKTWWKL